jgi:hypothetical protein
MQWAVKSAGLGVVGRTPTRRARTWWWRQCSLGHGERVVPLLGLVSPSLPGWLFLLDQAGAVALLAWLEAGARPAPAVA